MPHAWAVDVHPKKEEIIKDLFSGQSHRTVAKKYGMCQPQVSRYFKKVLGGSIVVATANEVLNRLNPNISDRQAAIATLVKHAEPLLESQAVQQVHKEASSYRKLLDDLVTESREYIGVAKVAKKFIYTGKKGEEGMLEVQDVSQLAPAINSAVRVAEVGMKATGELNASETGGPDGWVSRPGLELNVMGDLKVAIDQRTEK